MKPMSLQLMSVIQLVLGKRENKMKDGINLGGEEKYHYPMTEADCMSI